MSKHATDGLFIHLSGGPESPLYWLIQENRQILYRGHLTPAENLSALIPYITQYKVYLLLSSAEIGFHRVTLPGKHNAEALKGLVYALEERLADEAEQLHVVRLATEGQDILVAVIRHQWFSDLITRFTKAGITLHAVIPDVLLIPFSGENAVALKTETHWLIRTGEYQGAAVEENWLPLFCDAWQNEHQHPLNVYSYSAVPSAFFHWQQEPTESAPLDFLVRQVSPSSPSLLQGRYASRANTTRSLSQWRLPAIAAGCLLAILFIQQAVTYRQLSLRAEYLEKETQQLYQTQYPGAPLNQMRQQLRQQALLPGNSAGSALFPLMEPLASLKTLLPDLTLEQLTFNGEKGELHMTPKTLTPDQQESIQRWAEKYSERVSLEKSPPYTLILREAH